MSVKIGSARIDENGKAVGGSAGDQTGKEVSTQDWYLHKKGWVVIRAKDAAKREKIAYAMQRACDNSNIGYDQNHRYTAYDWCKYSNGGNYDPGAITKKVETDCSALVRLCCAYAGIFVGDFYTENQAKILGATGAFDIIKDTAVTNSSDYLLRGDILVTKTTGHTVVVLSNGSKAVVQNTKKEEEEDMSGKVADAKEFVELLYCVCLGRTPDEGGLKNWVNLLNSGVDPTVVVKEISQSKEGSERLIGRMYLDLLGRTATEQEIDTWRSTGKSIPSIIEKIMKSREYVARLRELV